MNAIIKLTEKSILSLHAYAARKKNVNFIKPPSHNPEGDTIIVNAANTGDAQKKKCQ